MELFTIGFATAFTVQNLTYCLVGVFLGTLVGVLPGIGPLVAVSLLLPFSFHLEPTTALVMLAGIYYGSEYGGSTTSILLNLPGQTASAVTCLDGYPMAQQGRAGVALFLTTIASFIGGSLGIVLLIVSGPWIAALARNFGSAEYFAALAFGLIAAASVAHGAAIKGIAMVVFGLLIGTVGADVSSGATRFTFGIVDLYDGLSLVVVAMGLFGVAEILHSVDKLDVGKSARSVRVRDMFPEAADMRRSWAPILRGSVIGSALGALPGTGPSVASFLSYGVEKRISKHPEMFGRGAVEGVAAPEASNNAAAQTAFLPTLSLGIPGSATMVLMLGALMIHGITPGPLLVSEHPEIFWGLIASFWIGNILLVLLNIPLIGVWVSLLRIPHNYLYPGVIALICVGVYSINNSVFDIWMVLVFGVIGYVLRILDFEPAPFLIGLFLGPLLEEHFRRAMLISDGNAFGLFDRPIAGTLLVATLLLIGLSLFSSFRTRKLR